MPQLFNETPGGARAGRRKVAGPPVPVRHEATPHGQTVSPAGAPPGDGITPDAAVRQRVLNNTADQRRQNGEAAGPMGIPGQEPQQVMPPPRGPTPLGTPPEQTAPTRIPAAQTAEMTARQA